MFQKLTPEHEPLKDQILDIIENAISTFCYCPEKLLPEEKVSFSNMILLAQHILTSDIKMKRKSSENLLSACYNSCKKAIKQNL